MINFKVSLSILLLSLVMLSASVRGEEDELDETMSSKSENGTDAFDQRDKRFIFFKKKGGGLGEDQPGKGSPENPIPVVGIVRRPVPVPYPVPMDYPSPPAYAPPSPPAYAPPSPPAYAPPSPPAYAPPPMMYSPPAYAPPSPPAYSPPPYAPAPPPMYSPPAYAPPPPMYSPPAYAPPPPY